MSLRSSEIAAVADELASLAGARVDSVRVHAERLLTLELRGGAGETTLLLCAEPDLCRIHVASSRPPPSPEPLAFQVLLRRELAGARLLAVEASPGDRVVRLRFERAGGSLSLVAELTGRHGNLLLVDGEGAIRAMAGRNLSPRRTLLPGQSWEPPGAREGEGGAPRFDPVAGAPYPLSAAVEAHYRRLEEERALAEARRRLRDPLRAAVARSRRALEKLADEAARVPAAEEDRRAADLLKQNLHAVRRGSAEVEVTEWTADGPRQVTLALDPALPPRENMERFYRRYRRIAESAARVEARAAEVSARLAATEALLALLDEARQDGLARLEREARKLGAAPRSRRPPRRRDDEPAPPYRTFRSVAGLPILVGRGAEENDRLTVRVAKGNDLWLHARGRPGAHVVLRLQKGRAPDQESLLDAAHLAAHFSDARGEAAPEVVYTRVKHVKKVKGAAPGAVTYSQEKGIALRVEPARVERLVQGEGEGDVA